MPSLRSESKRHITANPKWAEVMCAIKSQYHQTFETPFPNCRLDVSLGSIRCDKSISVFLTDDISIAYRHTTIRDPWPLYAWLIDCLTLSSCHGPGCKRRVVLVTHLSLCILPYEDFCGGRGKRYVGIYRHIDKHGHTHPSHNPLPFIYFSTKIHACTHKNQKLSHLTCSFPAPKDRSGTAVTWEVMRLGGVRLSRLWQSPMQGHRSLPAALAVWKVMGQSLTTMRRLGRVSKGGWGQWEAQIYRYWAEPQSSAQGNYTEYEHARWGLAAIFHFHPQPL